MEHKRKTFSCPRTVIQTSLERARPWLTGWWSSHWGTVLAEFARNLPSMAPVEASTGRCHTLELALKLPNRRQGEAIHWDMPCRWQSTVKLPERCWGNCWPLGTAGCPVLQQLGAGEAAHAAGEITCAVGPGAGEVMCAARLSREEHTRTRKRNPFLLQCLSCQLEKEKYLQLPVSQRRQ